MNTQKIVIVKHISREGPGLLKEILDRYEIKYEIVDLHQGEYFPDPKLYSALVVFGGPASANDATSKIRQALQRIQEATEAGIPYLGVCLGMQLMIKARGGEVRPHTVKEVGWRDPFGEYHEVNLTTAGKSDRLFTGVTSPFRVFHLHGETVKLTDGMQLLGTGKYCRNQVVKVGARAYGIQGHLELTFDMFRDWMLHDPDVQQLDHEALQADYEDVRPEYRQTGKTVFMNFLQLSGLL